MFSAENLNKEKKE